MRRTFKILGISLVFAIFILSISFASPFPKNFQDRQRILIIERERPSFSYSFQFSQELQNMIRERNRIQAEIRVLLRQEKVDFEKLQQNLLRLRELDNKIFEELKKDLLNNLDKSLRLRNEQKQKFSQVLDKYLGEIRNLGIELQNKNLELRSLSLEDKEKRSKLMEEILRLRIRIREMRTEMFREMKQVLDANQFRVLQSLLLQYNIKLRVNIF